MSPCALVIELRKEVVGRGVREGGGILRGGGGDTACFDVFVGEVVRGLRMMPVGWLELGFMER